MKLEKSDLEAMIVREHYFVVPETTLTICTLTLESDFNVVGQSACIDPDNFNADTGRHWARENAISKMWELEGYHQHRIKSSQ